MFLKSYRLKAALQPKNVSESAQKLDLSHTVVNIISKPFAKFQQIAYCMIQSVQDVCPTLEVLNYI